MTSNHAPHQKNKLPKIERDIAEAKVARKAVGILVKRKD